MTAKELLNNLVFIKDNAEYEFRFSKNEMWQEYVKTMEKAINVVKTPEQLKDIPKEEIDDLLFCVADMLKHSEKQAHTCRGLGEFESIYEDDIITLKAFDDFVKNNT